MQKKENEEENRYQLYLEYWREGNRHIASTTDLLDKNLLTISVGFIGFIITFIGLYVESTELVNHNLLMYGFVAFNITIIVTLFSFHLSMKEQKVAIDKAFEDLVKQNKINQQQKILSVLSCRYIAMITFVSGVIMTTIFSYNNIVEVKMNKAQKVINEGKEPITIPKPRPQKDSPSKKEEKKDNKEKLHN